MRSHYNLRSRIQLAALVINEPIINSHNATSISTSGLKIKLNITKHSCICPYNFTTPNIGVNACVCVIVHVAQ